MNWQGLSIELQTPGAKGEPLYAQIVRFVLDAIDSGELRDGERLPTNRELAAVLNVDRSTISRAYAELMAAGKIDSHVGRGSFVRSKGDAISVGDRVGSASATNFDGMPFSWNERFSRANRTVLELTSKQPPASSIGSSCLSFAGGLPTEEFYPSAEMQQIVAKIVASPQAFDLFEYSPAEGHSALRLEVLKHLKEQGIQAEQDELLIVSGSQQAIDLVTNVFIDPGDTVFLEDPSYFWAICNLRSHQARCVPIETDEFGMNIDALERALMRDRPKLIYIMPSFQNPTGAALSVERRTRLIELARKYGVPVLEDNFVGDLYYEEPRLPALRALPGGRDVVIHQGTFSKALCPGLRLGWLVAPREVLQRLLLSKRVCDLSTNSMAQLTLAEYLSAGLYTQHLERVRSAYKSRRDTMLGSLSKLFASTKVTWYRPKGGLFVWMTLPPGMSARALLRFAEAEDVTFSPGDLFFQSGGRDESLRLCFIQTDEKTIDEGIKRLAHAYRKYEQSISSLGIHRQDSLDRTREQVLI